MDKLSQIVNKLRNIHETKQLNEKFDINRVTIRAYTGNETHFAHHWFESESLRKFNNFNLKYCSTLIVEYNDKDDLLMFEFREFPNEK
jgi:hypothetical protein